MIRLLFPIVGRSRKQAGTIAGDLYKVVSPDFTVPDVPEYTIENLATGLRNRELPTQATPDFNRIVVSTAERHTEDAANRVLKEAAEQDSAVDGWARVHLGPNPPCAFCRLLISRGPVYSEDTAGFSAHDHCKCIPMPVKDRRKWDGQLTARAYEDEYKQAVKNAKATDGDVLNAYRRLVYGSGNPRGAYQKPDHPVRDRKRKPSSGADLRRLELETELEAAKRQQEVNENLNPKSDSAKAYQERMRRVFRKRIADLQKKLNQS